MSDKKCDLCDNPAMHIHAKCHITAPLRAEIDGTKLTLYCYVPECGRKVAQFEIDKDFYELYF